VSVSRLVALLVVAGAAAAPAQLAVTQPNQKLLLLPLTVRSAADSLISIQVMDAARERLTALARYKVLVVPKSKLCEALQASGYPCDVLMQDGEASQLARFLQVNAYNTGWLQRSGVKVNATVRMHENGGSGMDALFQVSASGTPQAVGDTLAQRLNSLIRAAESARDCQDKRQKGALPAALDAARKALLIEPNLPAAHLCMAVVYEAQRMPVDSMLNAYQRALKGDSLNGQAWDAIAHLFQQKNDTTHWIDALMHEIASEPRNARLRMATAVQLGQIRRYADACDLLKTGLELNPQDPAMHELRRRQGVEGEQWPCVLEELHAAAASDTTQQKDSTFLNTAIGAAQKANDATEQVFWTGVATKYFAKNAGYWNARGAAYDAAAKPDSALWAYRQSLALNPSNVATSLLVAEFIVNHAPWDTAAYRAADTLTKARLRTELADRVDSALAYLKPALAAPDSSPYRLKAMLIMLTAGQKITQSQAYDRAYPWLDQLLTLDAPATSADTLGPRQQIRIPASFFYGLASFQTLGLPFQKMLKDKSCSEGKVINDRLMRTRQALLLGRRVVPQTVDQILNNLVKYEQVMPQVKKAYKCTNF
jgi:tetratricopeptide (TPR) repeat protein